MFAGYSSQPKARTSSESSPRMAKLLWPISVAGIERNIVGRLRLGRGHAQHRHLVALADRRLDRPVIDDRGSDLAARRRRQDDVDVAVADQRHVMLRAAPDERVAHLLALVEQPERLEALEAPFEQLARLRLALLRRLEPADHEEQPLIAALGAGHQPVARLLDKAGLQPVDADIERDQRIAVMERELVAVLELLLAEEVVVLGIGVDEVVGERRRARAPSSDDLPPADRSR